MVIAKSQVMIVGNVPVDACQDLAVITLGREISVRSRIVVILINKVVAHLLHVAGQCTRHHTTGILALLACTVSDNLSKRLLLLVVHKEEEFVLDNRTAQGEAVGLFVLILTTAQVFVVDAVTAHILVAVVGVGCTLEGVRTTLRNGVDTTAYEVGLAHVEGSDHYLYLLNSIQRNRISATREVR